MGQGNSSDTGFRLTGRQRFAKRHSDMDRMKLNRLPFRLLLACLLCLAPSCAKDRFPELDPDQAGLDTKISLRLSVPEMSIATRGDMAPGTEDELNSLWVGIFSASGECTYAGFHTPPTSTSNHGPFYLLENIKAKSGPSRIVAVGNYNSNYGYDSYGKSADDRIPASPLATILPASAEAARADRFNWDRYCGIAVRQLAAGDIGTPVNNLLMSGVYCDFREHPAGYAPSDWERYNYSTVNIPASSTPTELSGAIHLRRLVSQVKFHITAGTYPDSGEDPDKRGKKIVNVTPQSYRVVNVPYTSWLHERATSGNAANSGDAMRLSSNSVDYGGGALPLKANYPASVTFTGNQYITGSEAAGYDFDFWMLENKRRALSDGITYYEREKEKKDAGANTGIYTALCAGDETMNNCAAFVEIRCRVEYTDEGLEAANRNNGDQTILERTADVLYTIHLGGINADWSDFAHRRNHKYTYEVNIVDIDKIIVEATEEDSEYRPGTEGVVTDIVDAEFEMDAHYGVLNVMLSNRERSGGGDAGAFPFRMEVWFNGRRIIIDQDNYTDFTSGDICNESAKLWQWVEFRPTTGRDAIADYKPYGKLGEVTGADGRTFRINEIADIDKFPGSNGNTNPLNTDEQWYTVFINEYVYESGFDEGANNWVDYVNQNDRIVWLNTHGEASEDGESRYIKAKYSITQKSIQSFYDMPGDRNVEMDALGMEHLNETFGFNLRWNGISLDGLGINNGRHNQWLYVNGGGKGDGWSDYVSQNTLQRIDNINTNPYQDYTGSELSAGPYYVPAADTYTNGNSLDRHDINTTYYLRILDACMNRNRDNNGNGRIDLEEIRWYLPASSEIIDLVIGRNSFTTPLMNYSGNPALNSPQTNLSERHTANTRFHFATSNNRVLWAEEGVTINPESDGITDNWNIPPQQVRCVRALGTNLATDNAGDLTPAFTWDSDAGPTKIYPTYYESKNMRSYSGTAVQPHQETSNLNGLAYNGFEFSPKLIGFIQTKDSTWVTEWEYEFPAGWYAEDGTYLGPEEYQYDIKYWDAIYSYYLDGMKDYDRNSGYFKAKPGTRRTDWDGNNPPLLVKIDGSEFIPEQHFEPGWYKLDLTINLVSSSNWNPEGWKTDNGSNICIWANGPFGGGPYLPDVTTRADTQISSDYYRWDTGFSKGTTYDWGWYEPDLTMYSDTNLPGYGYFDREVTGPDPNVKPGYYTEDGTYLGPEKYRYDEDYWNSRNPEHREASGDKIDTSHWKYFDVDKFNSSLITVGNLLKYRYPDPNGSHNNFVQSHDDVLTEANRRCTATYGAGWRVPNLKEAALIKLTLAHVKIFRPAGDLNGGYSTVTSANGTEYQIGSFLSSTYREYGVQTETRSDRTGFYTGIYYPENNDKLQDDFDNDGNLLGRIHCITDGNNQSYYIRCVRDLEE